MEKKPSRVPAILLIVLSVFAFLVWLILLFFAFFLGGSPGPEPVGRSVPVLYDCIVALGLLGSVLSFAAGIIGLSPKPAKKVLTICAILLGVAGGVPYYLIDLPAVGIFTLLPGVLPPLLYLILEKRK